MNPIIPRRLSRKRLRKEKRHIRRLLARETVVAGLVFFLRGDIEGGRKAIHAVLAEKIPKYAMREMLRKLPDVMRAASHKNRC